MIVKQLYTDKHSEDGNDNLPSEYQ